MKTVLIIDDQPEIVDAVKDILSLMDVRVLSAPDGGEGIRVYQEYKGTIDLILLDLFLPDISGQETLEALRELNPIVKVVLSSGYGNAGNTLKQLGNVVGFLNKPFEMSQLMEVVSQHLSENP